MLNDRSKDNAGLFTLENTKLDDLVSSNFSIRELLRSPEAARLGINNSFRSVEHLKSAVHLARNVLQPLRDKYGVFTPNSVYRCPELNKAIGGVANSQHMYGQAADIEIPGMTNFDLASYVQAHMDFDQVILEMYHRGDPHSGWVHISYKPEGNRKEALSYVNDGGKFIYRHGLVT